MVPDVLGDPGQAVVLAVDVVDDQLLRTHERASPVDCGVYTGYSVFGMSMRNTMVYYNGHPKHMQRRY